VALRELTTLLDAAKVAPLYGSVDLALHYPVEGDSRYESALSYLGTYAEDRQAALEKLFVDAARRLPDKKFLIGGALYPQSFPWTANIFFTRHLPPAEHRAFYCSSTLTLNVTRQAMARMGYCPSGRLFEAGACGAPILSDEWAGLAQFFEPGRELLLARSTEDVLDALKLPQAELQKIGRRARERVLDQHTADHRAAEMETILESARDRAPAGLSN
jgi:spore maturation protein CgeB